MEQIVQALAAKFPVVGLVLSILGSLVIIAQVVVVLTPSKKDDELFSSIEKGVFGKLVDLLKQFAPFQKK